MVDRVVTLEDAARFCGMLRTEEKAAATVEKRSGRAGVCAVCVGAIGHEGACY